MSHPPDSCRVWGQDKYEKHDLCHLWLILKLQLNEHEEMKGYIICTALACVCQSLAFNLCLVILTTCYGPGLQGESFSETQWMTGVNMSQQFLKHVYFISYRWQSFTQSAKIYRPCPSFKRIKFSAVSISSLSCIAIWSNCVHQHLTNKI